jgi:hypothetical protein
LPEYWFASRGIKRDFNGFKTRGNHCLNVGVRFIRFNTA